MTIYRTAIWVETECSLSTHGGHRAHLPARLEDWNFGNLADDDEEGENPLSP
jgi:hypothetical protein